MPVARSILVAISVIGLAGTAMANVPPSTIDSLSVTRSGGTVTVEGASTLGNASDSVVGTDVTGDAKISSTTIPPVPLTGLGMDLTSARIRHVPTGDQLIFTLTIADPMQQTFTRGKAVGSMPTV
jgi:hypothetical protein